MPTNSLTLLHDVFISYARTDASLGAAPLDAALSPHYRVWRDIRGIDPAQDFTTEIEKALEASRCIVICILLPICTQHSHPMHDLRICAIILRVLIGRQPKA